jgi:hypothetical protein
MGKVSREEETKEESKDMAEIKSTRAGVPPIGQLSGLDTARERIHELKGVSMTAS